MVERAFPERERRVHRRRPLSAPMWIVVGASRVPVSALNVSVGGALVHTSEKTDAGTLVRLAAELAGELRFTLEAEVVRVEPGVLGLRFLALGQRALEALLEPAISTKSAEADPRSVRNVGAEEASGSHGGV
jgi:hypothetical protein